MNMSQYAQMIRQLKTPEVMKRLNTLYGQREGMMVAQTTRYTALLKRHEDLFNTSGPVYMISAPGRTEISGNHTDHNRGKVLTAAVNLDTVAAVSPREDGVVNVHSEGYPAISISLDDLAAREDEKNTTAALIRGVAYKLQEEGYKIGGFDAAVTSTVRGGSGLSSSAAFEVMLCAIFDELYNQGTLDYKHRAKISQFAENVYFGKPSGLLDQLTSAVGGIIFADFADPQQPVLEKIHADGLLPPGMSLCVTDTRGSHSELTGEFAAIRQEMEQIAAFLGKKVLGQVTESAFWAALPALRKACGDRAVLRAIHYFEENARTLAQRDALQAGQFAAFAALVLESGRASFALCQNVYCSTDVRHQGLSVALALSQSILQGSTGAWRMQGGGFAGTIQAYVPQSLLERYHSEIERVFGKGSCYILRLREQGAVKVI